MQSENAFVSATKIGTKSAFQVESSVRVTISASLIEALEEAGSEADDFYAVGSLLRKSCSSEEIKPFVIAFAFMLQEEPGPEVDARDIPFGPSMVFEDEDGQMVRSPPPLDAIDPEVVESWSTAVREVSDSMVRARLADLLWTLKYGERPIEFVWIAIDESVSLSARQGRDPIYAARDLVRALHLSLEISDTDRRNDLIEKMVAFAEDQLAVNETPGAVMTVLSELALADPEARLDQIEGLLRRSLDKYRGFSHVETEIYELLATLSTGDARNSIRVEHLEALLKLADDQEEPMLRLHWLEQALDHSTRYGIHERADGIRVLIDAIAPEDLGLTKFSFDLGPDEARRTVLEQAVRDLDSMDQLFLLIARFKPPFSDPEQLDELIEEMARNSPFLSLLPRSLVGPEGAATIFRGSDDDSKQALFRAEQRNLAYQAWSVELLYLLDLADRTLARPARDHLVQLFSGDVVSQHVAERFTRSLELLWDGQSDEAAHLIIPRIERVFREIARRAGIAVMKEPDGDKPGGLRTLGNLLIALKPVFVDESDHAFFFTALADQLGLNLRNKIAHGLSHRAAPNEAALLIKIAIDLSMLKVGERVKDSPPDEDSDPDATDHSDSDAE